LSACRFWVVSEATPPLREIASCLHTFTCLSRGQLLIRARAVWTRRGYAASIAVRSYATRKPVAFGFINHTGFGGLYTSRGCVRSS
jgi:hypothetical protein